MILENQETAVQSHAHNFVDKDELFKFGITEPHEDILDVFKRVADSMIDVELQYGDAESADRFRDYIFRLMQNGKFIPNTTILMNAGRINDAPLSACAVPSADMGRDLSRLKFIIDQYHLNGMGTGFNFDDLKDPIPMIKYLNQVGVEGQQDQRQHRPVGNMGVLSLDHPKLTDFIQVKNSSLGEPWVFNFSVLVDDEKIKKLLNDKPITAKDGREIKSTELLDQIARSIHLGGEPGLVFIDRINNDNQVPTAGEYKAMAPCGEVGLVEGETCQFAYLNLGEFIEGGSINYADLALATEMAVRFLDDVIDYNLSRYKYPLNKEIAQKRRKIGLGVCGFADMLAKMGIDYNSPEARRIAENVFSFINYTSKKQSVVLAKQRGAFGVFAESKYATSDDNLIVKYADRASETVSREMWLALAQEVKECGIRNCSTTALPPTGRSSRIIHASPSVEPYFTEILKISPTDQLSMVSSIQRYVDESISKTVNVGQETSVDEIKDILTTAMRSNLKGVTIYRNGSRENQPKAI